jgi:hypothetical protein
MVRSCERVGWSGGKLDLVWTSLVCIDDSAWFLKTWLCLSRFPFLVIFGAFSWDFHGGFLEAFLCGIWCGSHTWGPCASFLGDIAPPNPWKVLRFGGFRWSSSSWGLVERFVIPHDWERFGAIHLRERLSTRWPRRPQSFAAIRWLDREIGWCKVESWPAVAVFPVCLGETGLTGLGNRSDRFWSQWPFKKIFGRHAVLCLRSPLVQVSSRLEFVCLVFGFVVLWGFSGRNRCDRFGQKCVLEEIFLEQVFLWQKKLWSKFC